MGLFDFLLGRKQEKKQTSADKSFWPESMQQVHPERTLKTVEYRAVGVNYYEKNLKKLARVRPEWNLSDKELLDAGKGGKHVFRYNYVNQPAELIPEPQNQHDKNAVKVVIAGQLVGYISRDENRKVLEILKRCEIKYISAFISGGEYRVILNDGGSIKRDDINRVNIKIGYV